MSWAQEYFDNYKAEVVRDMQMHAPDAVTAQADEVAAHADARVSHPECWYCGKQYYVPPEPNNYSDPGMCPSCRREQRS